MRSKYNTHFTSMEPFPHWHDSWWPFVFSMMPMVGHVSSLSPCLHCLSVQEGKDEIHLNQGLRWLHVSNLASENITDLLSLALQVLAIFVSQHGLSPLLGTRRAFWLQLRHMWVTISLQLGATTNTYSTFRLFCTSTWPSNYQWRQLRVHLGSFSLLLMLISTEGT